METFRLAVEIAGGIGLLGGALLWLLKTLRQLKDGIKALLRADMMHTYYKHHDQDELREYEAQNFELEYEAYKALGGNSFIDKIHKDISGWEVLP